MDTATSQKAGELLTGHLISKRTFGDWSIGTLQTEEGPRRIVGQAVTTLEEGQAYELRGLPTAHPKYGEQFDVSVALPHIPPERDALMRFLRHRFTGVGPKTAEQIVERYESKGRLQNLRRILIYEPWKLLRFTTAGSSKNIQLKPDENQDLDFLVNALALNYAPAGLPMGVIRRIAVWLVEREAQVATAGNLVEGAVGRFAADPYVPMTGVHGYGFTLADAVGRHLQISRTAPCRVAAIAHHVLDAAVSSEGHTFLPMAIYRQRVKTFDAQLDAASSLEVAMERGYDIRVTDQSHVYPASNLRIENASARMLARMMEGGDPIVTGPALAQLRSNVAFAARQNNPPLDEDQCKVLLDMLSSQCRLHTLTAGPGCGKTALMQVLAKIAGGTVRFCAPTGKAAKVLSQRVGPYGYRATTVHQLLEPTEDGFARGQHNPIEADVIVLDEGGMNDAVIFHSLLLALDAHTHLIVLGDRDQLPSVGYGAVLADLLSTPADHYQLDRTYRNQGDILALVRTVREGRFEPPASNDGSYHLVPIGNNLDAMLMAVEQTYLSAVQAHGEENAILLLPRRAGNAATPGWNTTYMNARLQQSVNPNGDRLPGTMFRIGDRIIIRKNMTVPQGEDEPSVTVVNGDTGRITSAQSKDGAIASCGITLDDGRALNLPSSLLIFVGLAYALTVHAAQGSEYHSVIFVLTGGPPSFIHRGIVYTAVSRPRQQLTVFADLDTARGVVRHVGGRRYSSLASKTRAVLGQPAG